MTILTINEMNSSHDLWKQAFDTLSAEDQAQFDRGGSDMLEILSKVCEILVATATVMIGNIMLI